MLLELCLLLVTLIGIYCYKMNVRMSSYWQDQGVKVPWFWSPVGNHIQFHPKVFMQKMSINEVAIEQYQEMKDEDADLFKQMLIKDFHLLVDRIGDYSRYLFEMGAWTDLIWSKQMTMAEAHDWKDIRSTFSPIFTTGKMKSMFPFIDQIREKLLGVFDKAVEASVEIELKEQLGKFSMDSIASCAFGVEAKSFVEGEETPFVKNARSIFRRTWKDMPMMILLLIPGGDRILQFFKVPIIKPNETKFFVDIVRQTLKQRTESKSRRNDLIDMMIDAMKNGHLETQEKIELEDQFDKDATFHHGGKKDFDELTLIATAMVMLVAGYDTTGTTMSYICFELARNPDIQRRLREEVDQAIEDNNGELPNYYGTQNLEYLDMVFHETLRLHTALGFLQRGALEDYTIPGTNITLKKGDEIYFNVVGMHADPKHFPNPDKFDPERFSKEGKESRHSYAFAGFGHGPRNCIGRRFALMEAKMAIVALLSKYEFCASERTTRGKIIRDPESVFGAAKDGLWINVKKR